MRRISSSRVPLTSINITPLLDVLLILVAVLLLLAPRLVKPLPVDLPRTSLNGIPQTQSSLQIAVRGDGSVWMDGHNTTLTEVRAHIAPGVTTLEIGGAQSAAYGTIVKIVEALRDSQPKDIVLLTQ
jgi:biopolymer transport protein TolR